jgi:NTP pyrophosphatase (non-canonical NTP hydrolase)
MTIADFKKYQEAARSTRVPAGDNPLVYSTLGLTGEAGELANKVKKILRGDGDEAALIAAIKEEMGDVLWYLSAMADDLGVTLDEIAAINVEKLKSRYARGVVRGSGDQR